MKRPQEGSSQRDSSFSASDSLFLLAQDLKTPLVAIAGSSELHGNTDAQLQAQRALRTLDAIVLGEQIASGQVSLTLQPVHIGSVMTDVKDQLRAQLKLRDIRADMALARAVALVDADPSALSRALTSLWHVMLSAVTSQSKVSFTARNYKDAVRVSLSSENADFSGLRSADLLKGSAQPIKSMHVSGADLLAMTNLASLMGIRVSSSRSSISLTLPKSHQLAFV